jgi:4-diphosphocytidyl-2-C-methyl-D-erythritol kinase
MVREQANAKINLFLDVLCRRDDGFHNIKSVMHSISLSDFLTVSAQEAEETSINVRSNVADLPIGKDNLVYRAAEKYLSHFNKNASVDIYIEKHIAISAGLAGGSSDAAATLRALNKIFNFATSEQLLEIASEIGSDVSFCLLGGTALCEGRGEIITPISTPATMHIVVAIGRERVSTPLAYSALDALYTDGFIGENEKCEKLISSLAENKLDFTSIYNIFENAVQLPEIAKIKEIMSKNRAESTLMSGSGPSVFGIFPSQSEAEDACKELEERGFDAYYATSVANGESI